MSKEMFSPKGMYYEDYTRQFWNRKSGGLAQRIVTRDHPETLYDIGAAMGYLIEDLQVLGVDAEGLEQSEYAVSQIDPLTKSKVKLGRAEDLNKTIFIPSYDVIYTSCISYLHPYDLKETLAYILRKTKRVLYLSAYLRWNEEGGHDRYRTLNLTQSEWERVVTEVDPNFKYDGDYRYIRWR